MTKVQGLDHISILVENAERSLKFYQDVLNLKLLPRPTLNFTGFWLDLMNGNSLHLMQLENPYKNVKLPKHGGRDKHFALSVNSIDGFKKILNKKKIPFSVSFSKRKAIFVHDPDQNVFELFEPSSQNTKTDR